MTLSNSALRAELGTTLKQLQHCLRALADHVHEHAHEAWVWQSPSAARSSGAAELSHRETLKRIAAAIQTIKYDDDQDVHESRIFPGILALASPGIVLTEEVNRHKAALARVLGAMEGRLERGIIDPRTGERGERPLREVALEVFYFRRLQHWQATRRLEILRERPNSAGTLEYVGFMWATSREVRRTSREALLEQANSPDGTRLTDEDVEVIKHLPAGEPLALVRPGHTTPKANIRWLARERHKPTTKVRLAVLPLIVPGTQLPARLRKLSASPADRQPRLGRTDIEIETTPLCRGLPVYRYLKPLRSTKRRLTKSTGQPPS